MPIVGEKFRFRRECYGGFWIGDFGFWIAKDGRGRCVGDRGSFLQSPQKLMPIKCDRRGQRTSSAGPRESTFPQCHAVKILRLDY
jgi:hypothetical protein